MAHALHVGDESGQPRADESRFANFGREDRLVRAPTSRALSLLRPMLLDPDRRRLDLDLLNHLVFAAGSILKPTTAIAVLYAILVEEIDLRSRELLPIMSWMSRLPPRFFLALPLPFFFVADRLPGAFTMSLDGGLFDVDEFFFDFARSARSRSFSSSSRLIIRTRSFFESKLASLSVMYYISTRNSHRSPRCSKNRERLRRE